jgi:hypothetical protein
MAEFEKYLPTRINRDDAVNAIYRGDRKFLPIDALDMQNVRVKGGGNNYLNKSIKSNLLKYLNLGEGVNTVIGKCVYEKQNRIIYFVHNNLNNHKIIEYNPDDDVFTVLMLSEGFGFLLTNRVKARTIDDFCVFNDRYNKLRSFNIQRAKNGEYDLTFPYLLDDQISLARRPDFTNVITTSFVTDVNKKVNLVCSDSWQFAFRYIYPDNAVSVFSMLSKVVPASFRPNVTSTTDNTIRLNFNVNVFGVEAVELAYRKNETGDYYVFHTIRDINGISAQEYDFTNTESSFAVAPDESAQLYDVIPDVVQDFEVVDNRLFIPLDNSEWDVDESLFTLTLTVDDEAYVPDTKYFKEGSAHKIGIVFYDLYGKNSGVKGIQTVVFDEFDKVNTPKSGGTMWDSTRPDTQGVDTTKKQFINWTLAGSAPTRAVSMAFVMTKNLNNRTYFQCSAICPMIYEKEAPGATDSTTGNIIFREKQFYSPGAVFPGQSDEFILKQLVYIQIPQNVPFIAEVGNFLKIKNANYTASTIDGRNVFQILDVQADWVVINNNLDIKTEKWEDFADLFIEIYTIASPDNRFYEIGEIITGISVGLFPTFNGRINGDTYQVTFGGQSFDTVSPYTFFTNLPTRRTDDIVILESPTSTTSRVGSTERKTYGGNVLTFLFGLDYSKSCGDYGRVHIELPTEKQKSLMTLFGFSDPYILNSNLNGLNRFRATNNYSIASDRGPLTSLIRSGDNLLAVHNRKTSVLYIGQGFIRQGSDFILAKTEGVVGDDSKLQDNYGTINPESVFEQDDRVYFWDAINGAVVVYTKAGLYPISNYGLRNEFLQRSRLVYQWRSRHTVLIGYDLKNDELIVCFSEVRNNSDQVVAPAQTWRFDVTEREWRGRASFIPEDIIGLNQDLYTWKAGQLYLHESGNGYNTFYGVKYSRIVKFVSNVRMGMVKRFLNIHIGGPIGNGDTIVNLSNLRGQISSIPASEFTFDEGKYVAPILRDVNTPVESNKLALYSGDYMTDVILEVEVVNESDTEDSVNEYNVVYKTEQNTF